ncbi:SH3 domain-containing protein [Sphingomonas sp. Y38-1Y]|uniref:SH3 domain-containing protein n=1 Tax=Sphingomonas sp. Y38-1Y TaxID=3078265 RepID=UPI0028F04B7A|nr:SH3 domain-containing protein [Sphingomonas sp. Y38-1Y]
MRVSRWSAAMAALLMTSLGVTALEAQTRKPPYYASISASKARMRTGPGRNYPASWLYVRADLPIKVVDIYRDWRKVEDPGGTQGWMQVGLLSDTRTAIIQGGIAVLRDQPAASGRTAWRAAPGVVGRISRCARGWCYLDVKGRGGFVEQARLWGVAPDEDMN